MPHTTYRYRFQPTVPMVEVDSSLLLATMACEGIYGRIRVRLEGRFCLDPGSRTCVIDAGSELGRSLARIFTGFLTQQFGEKTFTVEETDTPVPT